MPVRPAGGTGPAVPSATTYTRPIPSTARPFRSLRVPSRPVWIGLLVVLVLIVAAVGIVWLVTRPAEVNVSAIDFDAPSGTCGLSGSTTDGFTAAVGNLYPMTLSVTNRLATACTISSVTTSTAGFSISSANVPLSVPSGGSALLTFNLGLPSNAYQGPLVLVVG